jgi:hypothetical protein
MVVISQLSVVSSQLSGKVGGQKEFIWKSLVPYFPDFNYSNYFLTFPQRSHLILLLQMPTDTKQISKYSWFADNATAKQ